MKKFFPLVLFFLFVFWVYFIVIPVYAKGPPMGVAEQPEKKQCFTIEFVKKDAREKFIGSTITEISGSEMVSFMIGFNDIKPTTNIVADSGIIVDKPNAPAVTIVLFQSGCYSAIIFLRRAEFRELMGQVT